MFCVIYIVYICFSLFFCLYCCISNLAHQNFTVNISQLLQKTRTKISVYYIFYKVIVEETIFLYYNFLRIKKTKHYFCNKGRLLCLRLTENTQN